MLPIHLNKMLAKRSSIHLLTQAFRMTQLGDSANKFFFLIFICTAIPSLANNVACKADSCDLEATGKTYLDVRPLFKSNFPEQWVAFRDDRLHARFEGIHGALEVVLFGSKSTNPCDIARYFFPNGCIVFGMV